MVSTVFPKIFSTKAAWQALLNSWLASGPWDLSQAPLLTETIWPAWQVMPPLERK
jgi:hypothetical protein